MAHRRWTRRGFLGSAAAFGTLHGSAQPLLRALPLPQEVLPPPRSQANAPEVINGKLTPLLESNVARPLRYTPEVGGFMVRNGTEFFNRPLYGPNIPFRADGGDLPEFSLYLPGHGGNLRLGIRTATGQARWLPQLSLVITRYIDGRLSYDLRDPSLGKQGLLTVEALTRGAALWIRIAAFDVEPGLELLFAFGGVSGRKGERNGDIGCEKQPVSAFFQLRPEECAGNVWTLHAPSSAAAEVQGGKVRLRVTGPREAHLRLGEAAQWNDGWGAMWNAAVPSPHEPVLLGRAVLQNVPLFISVDVLEGAQLPATGWQKPAAFDPDADFSARRTELETLARRVCWQTPDEFLNGMAGALCIAADALWDEAQGCVMHGAVAWRIPLAGWRGPYALDVLARHDRMQRHLRHWIARQNVSLVTNGSGGTPTASGFRDIMEASGAPDPGSHDARTENLLHSAGDLSHNHYDMNLVFFDALLRHLRWTGDVAFAREAWPALERHAAWERRLFRRDYGTSAAPLPLYEAYAAIWASDNLQYNGGGAAHSSAYNIFLNREMGRLAGLLGLSPEIACCYAAEADAISQAMRDVLWMPGRGAFAEGREWLSDRRLQENPAVWTMYQTLDSEVTTPREAWQMAADRLRALRKVPVIGPGVPEHAGWQIGCSNWQPYVWSLTLLVLAENLATALALYQAGMAEEGYGLLRGSLLDAGYRGLCPGNLPMSLQLDPHRGESQRDFGDPIGCAWRVLVEGLWGIQPNLPERRLTLKPQPPEAWNDAQFHHPELDLVYQRNGLHESWKIVSRFPSAFELRLELRARTVELPTVLVAGRVVESHFAPDAVGAPRLVIALPLASGPWNIEVRWRGEPPAERPLEAISCVAGEPVAWPRGIDIHPLHDPQGCLRDGVPHRVGGHTVFALQAHGGCRFWMPLDLRIAAKPSPAQPLLPRPGARYEPVPLTAHFTGRACDVFSRGYGQPRSGLCSLNLPDGLLAGWANFNVTAAINDAGLRGCGGQLRLPNGVPFNTPSGNDALNCCFVSQWSQDQSTIHIPLNGGARSLHLLLIGTTFPQATGSCHASIRPLYNGETKPAGSIELRSPWDWWPVEQDYLADDFLFRLDVIDQPESRPLPLRVDLLTGRVRPLILSKLKGKGGPVEGGAAFVQALELDPAMELKGVELRCELYGVVLGVLGVTLGR